MGDMFVTACVEDLCVREDLLVKEKELIVARVEGFY